MKTLLGSVGNCKANGHRVEVLQCASGVILEHEHNGDKSGLSLKFCTYARYIEFIASLDATNGEALLYETLVRLGVFSTP